MVLDVIGGNGSAASSLKRDAQSEWKKSLDDFKAWQPIGYGNGALTPVIDYLDPKRRAACYQLLKEYFLKSLLPGTTKEPIGNTKVDGGAAGYYLEEPISYDRRIHQMFFRYGNWMKGFCTIRKQQGARVAPAVWNGGDRTDPIPAPTGSGQQYDEYHSFTLDDDDEIVEVEVFSIKLVDGLVFHTANGLSFPPMGRFGGTHDDLKKPEFKHVLRAPRIRGFCGHHAQSLDSFGLRWLFLGKQAESRTFLLVLESKLMGN